MRPILLGAALLGLAGPADAQVTARRAGAAAAAATATQDVNRFASRVVSLVPGPGAALPPANMLGGPRGGGLGSGSLHVTTLGDGGSATLGFDATIVNGPGADLIVFENAFGSAGGTFAEVLFVEVSTDGVSFARFPSSYAGPVGPLPPFGASPIGTFRGLAGSVPTLANVVTSGVDPFDPAVAGGEAFDLELLRNHPAVASGLVDLDAIRFVRLVDAVAGADVDSAGTTIWDHGAGGGADVDAVAVIQHAHNQLPNAPVVDLWVDAGGFLNLVVHDPDGLADVPAASRRASLDLVPMSWAAMEAALFVPVSDDGFTRHLRSPAPVDGSGTTGALGVSVRDAAGGFAADQFLLQG